MNLSWYVLKIRSGLASVIQSELSKIGITHYFPMLKHYRTASISTQKPLFPGYLFIQVENLEESTPYLNRIQGIIGFLFQDDLPAIIEAGFMNKLHAKVTEINEQEGVWRTYNIGDKVLLEAHGLSTIGTVVQHSMADKTRVRILIDFMGKEIKADVNWFNLAPYEAFQEGNNLHNRRRTRGRNRPIKTYIAA